MSSLGRITSIVLTSLALVLVGSLRDARVEAQDATPPPTSSTPGELPMLSPPANFSLEETAGGNRTLTEVRGRVAIVFYEDREHTSDNQDLKHTLHRYVLDNQLRDQIATYGIANVTGLDGMMRDMARTAIRTIASNHGIQILMDWEGAMQRAPFGFPGTGATIALFDRQGRMRYRVTGAHTAAQQTELFRALRRLIRAT